MATILYIQGNESSAELIMPCTIEAIVYKITTGYLYLSREMKISLDRKIFRGCNGFVNR